MPSKLFGKTPPKLSRNSNIAQLRRFFSVSGWETWSNSQGHIAFSCRHPEHGQCFISKLDEDTPDYVPMDAIASTAAQWKTPVVVFMATMPKAAHNQYMMQRNGYLLSLDQVGLVGGALAILRLEQERQAIIIDLTAKLSDAKKTEIGLTRASLIEQTYQALLDRDPTDGDIVHYASILAAEKDANVIRRMAQILVKGSEFAELSVKKAREDAT